MTRQSPPDDFGGFDFELTDFDDARRALDELPAGVAQLKTLEPGYWERQRRPQTLEDRVLTGPALDWLLSLPAEARPKVLADRFPRVVNRLAQYWYQPAQRRALLEELMTDRRGQRMGFPAAVLGELQRLGRIQPD